MSLRLPKARRVSLLRVLYELIPQTVGTFRVKHPIFHLNELCRIGESQTCPQLSGRFCKIIGLLQDRPAFDDFGNYLGKYTAYKVRVRGWKYPVSAPENMLRKVWVRGNWEELAKIWQPKPVQLGPLPKTWKVWK